MEKKLELWLPYAKKFITQSFEENANALYKEQGLVGHTAIDWGRPWGTAIPCCADNSYVYSILNRENPDPTKYRAVCTIVETQEGVYEVIYGHCSEIFAEVGKTYNAGEVLANVGNTGAVYASGVEVTKEARLKGSKAGAHLHGPQVRVLKKVSKRTGAKLIYDGNGVYRDKQGFYYEIPTYNNGVNGCIDPMPLFNKYLASDASLVRGDLEKKVSLLTQVLALLGILRKR